jgi:mycothione reductase
MPGRDGWIPDRRAGGPTRFTGGVDDPPERYDLIIIGTGSGNAIPDYLDGWKIAVVERDVFGGTCINRGCVPSKMFVLPADVAHEARHSARLGLDVQVGGADWAAIRDRVFGRIDPISVDGREYRANGSPNITLIEVTARFVAPKLLDVENRTITADHILIAAGTRPTIPPIAGLVEIGFHTSDSIMRLERLPERIGIIGGGFIAAEMGHVFEAYGSKVSIFTRSQTMLRMEDVEVSQRFTELFSKRVDLYPCQLPSRIERRPSGIVIHCHDREVEVDELLVATGREPNTDLLDAEVGGVDLHHHGTIVVDQHLRTSAEGVWAIGDIANAWHLKHVANEEATVAFWNIAHPDEQRSIDYSAVPSAVFTAPQVASVGLTEQGAVALGRDVAIGRRDYADTAYGWALADETSFAKVLVDPATRLILGGHIIGPQASILIQPLVQAMQFGQTADEVAHGQYWIHPAMGEVVENALIDALARI